MIMDPRTFLRAALIKKMTNILSRKTCNQKSWFLMIINQIKVSRFCHNKMRSQTLCNLWNKSTQYIISFQRSMMSCNLMNKQTFMLNSKQVWKERRKGLTSIITRHQPCASWIRFVQHRTTLNWMNNTTFEQLHTW